MTKAEYIKRHGEEKYKEKLEKHKAYRDSHKKEIAEYKKAYQEANKQMIAEKKKARYQANRDKYLEYHKAYYESHREERLEYQKAYEKDHKYEKNEYKKELRRRKREEQYIPINVVEGEIWKPVLGCEDDYMASNLGRIKSLNYNNTGMESLLKQSLSRGYQRVSITRCGVHKSEKVHRLVYEAFNGKIPDDMQVNHIDENKLNNNLSNLNLMTCKENINWGTGRERSAEHKKRWVVAFRNDDDHFKLVFRSSADAAEMFTGNRKKATSITAVINGRLKTWKNLKWRYLNVE